MPTLLASARQRLRDFLGSLIPTQRVTIVNPLSQPFALAPLMTVDRVQEILRSAEAGDPRDLFALYRDTILADSHLQGELSKRLLAVLGDTFSVQPIDKGNADDVAAAAAVKAAFESCPSWQAGIAHLLTGTLWPVSVVEKVYQATPTGYALAELVPVDPQLLDFTTGWLMIRQTDPISHFPTSTLMAPDPNRYIAHRGHLLSTPDHWGGPMRSLLFWWLLGAMNREWWGRFLDRFGTPFLLGKYDQSDDASRSILANAFRLSAKIGGLVVSRETEVSIMQAAATGDSGEAFEKFYMLTRREMSKLILGQTLSAEAQPTGLGSGTSDLQSEVRDDIRQFDAQRLGATLTLQLAKQFLTINNLPGRPPRLIWGGNSASAAASLGTLLQALHDAGLQVADDALPLISERVGFNVGRAPAPAPPAPGEPATPGGLSAYAAPRLLPRPLLLARHSTDAADAANDAIAREGAADLSRAFRGDLAPVRQIILSSRSSAECEHRLIAWCTNFAPGRAADVIEQALIAHAANGAARLTA
jgi:phage gp29-like protein